MRGKHDGVERGIPAEAGIQVSVAPVPAPSGVGLFVVSSALASWPITGCDAGKRS